MGGKKWESRGGDPLWFRPCSRLEAIRDYSTRRALGSVKRVERRAWSTVRVRREPAEVMS